MVLASGVRRSAIGRSVGPAATKPFVADHRWSASTDCPPLVAARLAQREQATTQPMAPGLVVAGSSRPAEPASAPAMRLWVVMRSQADVEVIGPDRRTARARGGLVVSARRNSHPRSTAVRRIDDHSLRWVGRWSDVQTRAPRRPEWSKGAQVSDPSPFQRSVAELSTFLVSDHSVVDTLTRVA